jgi:O-antigen/teichoic acid export membrane protein
MLKRFTKLAMLILLRLVGVGLQFAVQLVVARLTGAAGLGLLQVFSTWTCVLGEAIASGRPAHAMKTLAVAKDHSSSAQLQAYLQRGLVHMLLLWSLALIFALLLSQLELAHERVLWMAVGAAILFAVLRLMSEALKSLAGASTSVFVENAGPALILLLGCTYWSSQAGPVAVEALLLVYAAGFGVCALVLWLVCRWRLLRLSGADTQPLPAPLAELAPLWGVGLLSILFMQLPFLFMPYYANPAEIGQFALAFKLVNLISTILLLLGAIYGPRFARLIDQGDRSALGRELWSSQYTALLLYLPALVLLIVFASPLLEMFGGEFADAQRFLWILAAGQLVNAATGLPGLLLNMGGGSRQELACLALSLVLATVGALLVGPHWGASGIAVVYSTMLAGKNLASLALAWRVVHDPKPVFRRSHL